MKRLTFLSLVGIISIALAHTGWAAGHQGGAGVFDSAGGFGGGHEGGGGGGGPGGGVSSRGGGVGFGRPSVSGRSAYYYSRGMHYTKPRPGQVRSPVPRAPSPTRMALAFASTSCCRPRCSLNANSEPDQLLISAERNRESEV